MANNQKNVVQDDEIEAAALRIARILTGDDPGGKASQGRGRGPLTAKTGSAGPKAEASAIASDAAGDSLGAPAKPRHPAMKKVEIIGVSSRDELEERARAARSKLASEARRSRSRKPMPQRSHVRFEVTCPCGEKKSVPRWRAKTFRYCSSACRVKYGGKRGVKKYPPYTAEQDAEIIRVYLDEVGMSREPVVKALAEKFGLPRWKISRRAQTLGVLATLRYLGKKPPEWTEAEDEILRQNSGLSLERIRLKLTRSGFKRSLNAIKIRLTRYIGRRPSDSYTERYLSKLLGTDCHAIPRWIKSGYLRANKRGTRRDAAQGGDIWEIWPQDVKAFVVEHVALIDFRKIDKFWLVELLTASLLPVED